MALHQIQFENTSFVRAFGLHRDRFFQVQPAFSSLEAQSNNFIVISYRFEGSCWNNCGRFPGSAITIPAPANRPGIRANKKAVLFMVINFKVKIFRVSCSVHSSSGYVDVVWRNIPAHLKLFSRKELGFKRVYNACSFIKYVLWLFSGLTVTLPM